MLLDVGVPIVTFLIGGIVGHWLTLVRDRRKESNEYVDPLRERLREYKEDLSPMASPVLSAPELSGIRERSSPRAFAKVSKANEEFDAVNKAALKHKQIASSGYQYFKEKEKRELSEAIDNLLNSLKRC